MDVESIKQARIDHVDLFRAFGIILMIMGHIRFGSLFDKWIHGFHMPMFFFVSGFFYRKRDTGFGEQIRKKAKSLLLPYFTFYIVQWLVLMFFVPEYRTWDMLRYMVTDNTRVVHIASGTYSISPIPGALWFLTAMFFTDVLYIALDRELGFGWKLHAAVVVISVLGMAFPTILPFRLPCAMDASFAGLCFFHLARSVRGTRWEKLLNLRLWQSLLGGAVFSVLIILSPSVNMRKGDYGWLLPFWINAMGAIVVLWSFSKNIESFLAVNLTLVNKWLKSIGRNSIVYLCLNQSIIVAALKLLDALGLTGTSAKLPALVLTMTLLLGFEKLLCNTGLRLIIGK